MIIIWYILVKLTESECELDLEDHFEEVEMADFSVEFPTMIVEDEDEDEKRRRKDENLDGEQQQQQQIIIIITENEENLEGCMVSDNEEHMEDDQVVPETSFSDIAIYMQIYGPHII